MVYCGIPPINSPKTLEERIIELMAIALISIGIIGVTYGCSRRDRQKIIQRYSAENYTSGSDSYCYQVNAKGRAELVVKRGNNFFTYQLPEEDKGER